MKKVLISLIFLFLALIFYLTGRPFQSSKIFIVESGQSLQKISQNLKNQQFLNSRYPFYFYVLIKGKDKELKPGYYSFSPSDSFMDIADKIIEGKNLKEEITIIEGWNLMDIGEYLETKGIVSRAEDFYNQSSPMAQKDFSEDFDFLKDKPKGLLLEGYLFPDTYEINKGAGIEEIVRKMLDNFDQKLTSDLKDEIKKQNKTIFEIVITASLLEKEVKTKEDKELVSGILWKRLKSGIPLQVDATITYITGNKTTRVSKEDTQIDSPYNTYKYLGLPLGPICNPGIESILAAIYPKDSDYWYYLSTPEGEIIFSKTLKEHNIAKAKYLK